jgi:dTDP-L-rhamnose 4-epimerase
MNDGVILQGKRIFVTGGAGFIGSRLVRRLASAGAEVRVYDVLLPQVHGTDPQIDLPAQLVRGDVRDRALFAAAITEFQPHVVVHLAAETGTGQSADEPSRYTSVNVVGTANLIEIVRALQTPPERIVLAGTRAVYGEGAYRDGAAGPLFAPPPRTTRDMAAGRFDLYTSAGATLEAVRTPENLSPAPASVYGSTKLMQEYLLQQCPLPCGVAILRLQNVYGPGQSLQNPYTGVLSIFCSQAMEGRRLNIYEDGEIIRDFVFVDDVVSAFAAACVKPSVLGRVVNIGSGKPTSMRMAAERILANLGRPATTYDITGMFRPGDVRYAVADTSLAEELLGWHPAVSFDEGIAVLTQWAKDQPA